MSHISEEMLATKPKKPLNAYFLFRSVKIAELKDEPNKMQFIKKAWEQMDANTKTQMEETYRLELIQYHKDNEAWLQVNNLTNDQWNNRGRAMQKNQQQGAVEKRNTEKVQEQDEKLYYLNQRVSQTFEELRFKRREFITQSEEIRDLRDQLKRANQLIQELERTNNDLQKENQQLRTFQKKVEDQKRTE